MIFISIIFLNILYYLKIVFESFLLICLDLVFLHLWWGWNTFRRIYIKCIFYFFFKLRNELGSLVLEKLALFLLGDFFFFFFFFPLPKLQLFFLPNYFSSFFFFKKLGLFWREV